MTMVHSGCASVPSAQEGDASTSDLPTPKFRIGQTVYYQDTDKVVEQLDCPDCLGTKKWRVDLPSGEAHDVACQRCCGGMTYSRADELPTLNYEVFKPVARPFLIANVEAKARGWHGEKAPEVRYGNSDSQWRDEPYLFADEADALALAVISAAGQNAKAEAKAERIQLRNIGALKFDEARYDQFSNGLWNAWYAYRDLTGKLTEHLDRDDGRPSSEVLEGLRDDLRWDLDYHTRQERPLDVLVEAVESALAGDATKLADAYAKLPEALHSRPAAASDEVFA